VREYDLALLFEMPGETILIVEDSAVCLKLTAAALRAEGYRVQVASTAEQALSSLRSSKPDLILVDIMLPGMDGLEFTKRIKQDSRLRDVTVLALTACDMEGDEERARNAGCDGYLTKPIDKQTLKEIRHYLDFGAKAVVPAARSAEPPPGWEPEASTEPVALAIPIRSWKICGAHSSRRGPWRAGNWWKAWIGRSMRNTPRYWPTGGQGLADCWVSRESRTGHARWRLFCGHRPGRLRGCALR